MQVVCMLQLQRDLMGFTVWLSIHGSTHREGCTHKALLVYAQIALCCPCFASEASMWHLWSRSQHSLRPDILIKLLSCDNA